MRGSALRDGLHIRGRGTGNLGTVVATAARHPIDDPAGLELGAGTDHPLGEVVRIGIDARRLGQIAAGAIGDKPYQFKETKLLQT